MGNCLVTKLKGSVDNDNLEILGALRINVHAQSTPTNRMIELGAITGKTLTVKITGGTFHIEGQSQELTEHTFSGSLNLIVSNNNCYMDVSSKYDIMVLRMNRLDHEVFEADLVYLTPYAPVTYLMMATDFGKGELIFGNPDSQKQLVVSDNGVPTGYYTNIDQFANASLINLDIRNENVYGNILSLGKCISLAMCNIINSKVTGDVDALGAALLANGKTSGSFVLSGPLNNVTDEGNYLTSAYLASKGNGGFVALDFANGTYTKKYSD